MKITEILPKDFLEQVASIDPEMLVFFKETDIDDNNRARMEKLRDDAQDRDNFLNKLIAQLEPQLKLAQVLPVRFTKLLKQKDNLLYQLLTLAPSRQYSSEIKEAFKQERVQDLVLSWFDSGNHTMARYRALNLAIGDIAEALVESDSHARVTVEFLRELSQAEPEKIVSAITDFSTKYQGANLVNEQDQLGRILAHYVAERGLTRKYFSAIQEVLFTHGSDFSIQDNNGDTPMHVMASNSEERASSYMFRDYIDHAARTHFDFSLLNNAGLSVLHLASISQYVNRTMGLVMSEDKNVAYILNAAQANNLVINLDVLSRSGSTALYYLINHQRYDEANLLLDAGADPSLYGSKDRDPLEMINIPISALEPILSLVNAYKNQKMEKFVVDFIRNNKKLLVSLYQERYSVKSNDERVEPTDESLEAFVSTTLVLEYVGGVEILQKRLAELNTLKQRLISIAAARQPVVNSSSAQLSQAELISSFSSIHSQPETSSEKADVTSQLKEDTAPIMGMS